MYVNQQTQAQLNIWAFLEEIR